jgi:tight adherence protein C
MALLIGFASFLLLTSVIIYFGYRVYFRPARVYEHVTGETSARPSAPAAAASGRPSGVVRIIRMIGERVPVSPAEAGLTRRYLMAAGFRSDHAPQIFYGLKMVAITVLLLLGLVVRDHLSSTPIVRWAILGAFGALGWFGPGLVLDHLVGQRQRRLRRSLPDALDLMVVCIEAGNALDQAFVRVSKDLQFTHKDISDEFSLVTLEMRAGKRRAEALHNLAQRTGERELQKLVAIMIQADRFGTSIADSLRVHADFMRVARRQEAEERAGKVGVKLVFPIFFFILPAMFLVTAGPGMIQIVKTLLPALKQAGNMH